MTKQQIAPLQLTDYALRVQRFLAAYLPTTDRLTEALRYATLNGGKRLRPALVYLTGETFGAMPAQLDPIASAIECIHCYSLIHDDLPAMDDDELRRGLPTCHIQFDEATAILAGDALQTLAFEILSENSAHNSISATARITMIRILAQASGFNGMVGGQALDLAAEGKTLTTELIEAIHQKKTGALIVASIQLGAIAAGIKTTDTTFTTLTEYGQTIGLAFQLQDDLLDVIGQADKIGKKTGQDDKHQKATYTSLLGIEKTQQKVDSLFSSATEILKSIPENTDKLIALCTLLHQRDY